MNQIRNEFEQLQQQQQHSIERKSSYSAHTNNVYSNWFVECHLACALCVCIICARVCVCWILYSNWVSVSVYRIKYQSKLNMHIVSIWMRSQENNTNNEHEPFRTLYALIEKKRKIKKIKKFNSMCLRNTFDTVVLLVTSAALATVTVAVDGVVLVHSHTHPSYTCTRPHTAHAHTQSHSQSSAAPSIHFIYRIHVPVPVVHSLNTSSL